MTSIVKILRSSTTALTGGSSTLAYGVLAVTNISGITRFYVGDSSNIAQEIAGAAFAKLASPAFTGTPTAPTASSGTNTTQLATTQFVTSAVQASAAGLVNKGVVTAATTGALPAYTYDNGTSGVGATITATSNGALPTQDGITLSTSAGSNLLLVKDETAGNDPYNGLYVVTQLGDVGTPFILTRTTNFDSSDTIEPNSIVTVSQGDTQADTMWWITLDGAVVVGTTDIDFSQFGVTPDIIAGDGLNKTGSTLDVLFDDSSIDLNGSNQLQVKAGGVTNAMLAGSIADSKLNTITTANKVSGSAVQLASGSAIENNTGLDVNIDATSIINTAGQLSVGTVDAGTF